MTNPPNLPKTTRQLAQQGDPQAIAALINQPFQRQGLRAEVKANNRQLEVSIYSDQAPSMQCVKVLQSGLAQLGIQQFSQLRVKAYQQDLAVLAWVETVALSAIPAASKPSAVTEILLTNKQTPSVRPKAPKVTSAAIAPSQTQWQALQEYLPRFLHNPKMFAVAFIAGMICLVLKPLMWWGMVLIVGSIWWFKHRHRRQSLPTALQQLPAWLETYPWEWWLAAISLYCWVVSLQGSAYLGIAVSFAAIAKLLISTLHRRRDRTAMPTADLCLMANLHGLLLVLNGMMIAPGGTVPLVNNIGIVVGLGLVMQLGYRLRSAALFAHVFLTLSLLIFMFAQVGSGLYVQFDRPYYDTQGYGLLFGLYALVAVLMYLGLIAISSFVLWGFGCGLAKNGRVGYAFLLISPYLAWAFVFTKLVGSR